MIRSDLVDTAARIRDGVCVLGCTSKGVHYATCDSFGDAENTACRGCAPAPAYVGSLVCSRCFGRARALLRDAPDLIARIRSLSDPAKAMLVEPVKVFSRPVEAIAPVGPDLLDAAGTLLANLRDWAHTLRHEPGLPWHSRTSGLSTSSAFDIAAAYSRSILAQLEAVTSDPALVVNFAEAILVAHPEVEGERQAWSITDAMDRWGAERRDRHVHPDVDAEPDREVSASPVREWYDPTLSVKEAAARHGVKTNTVRKWVASGELPVAMRARGPRGSVMLVLYASEVDRVAALMAGRRNSGRPATTIDTPEETVLSE